MVDRNSLLTAGGGISNRMLPDSAVESYCGLLEQRLAYVRAVFEAEQQAQRLSAPACANTMALVELLRETMTVMVLKHSRQQLETEPLPLTIDPTESGFPTFKDFWSLQEDHTHARERLVQIPAPPALIEQALTTILSGNHPFREQIMYLDRAYLERLLHVRVLHDFSVGEPQPLADEQWAIGWTRIVRSVNRFESVTMHVRTRGGAVAMERLKDHLAEHADAQYTVADLVGVAAQEGGIVPQHIERVTIGPYYHQWTDNDELIQRTLAAAPDDDPFLLKLFVERVEAQPAPQRSMMETLMGRELVVAGPIHCQRVLVTLLPIKQYLGDADEDRQPCIVYGISRQGDLVC